MYLESVPGLPASTSLAPSTQELVARRNTLLARMDELGLTHMVMVDPDNVFWLTNFANFVHERPFVLILAGDGSLRFIVPALELPHVKVRAIGDIEILTYAEFPAPEGHRWSDVLAKCMSANDRAGIELTCPHYISAALPGAVHATEMIERARFIKSDYEIGRIRYACDIVTDQLNWLLKNARADLSAGEISSTVNASAYGKMLRDDPNLNYLATKIHALVQPARISDDPHNYTSLLDLGIEDGGPNVSIIAGKLNGYGAEVERTFFVGKVPEEARRPYDAMMQARHLTISLCRAGASMHEVDAAVFDLCARLGYGNTIVHRAGHGIGVTSHEGPFLARGYHEEIQPGMVFTIEPGVYVPGLGGFRHSDTVLVTEAGLVNLTSLPDSLEAMTISS